MQRKPVSYWHLIKRLRLYWLGFPLVFALGFGGIALSIGAQVALLAREGVSGDALVIARQIERRRDSDGKETVSYYLRYRYNAEGRAEPIEKRQSVSRRLYDRAREGQSIPVTYAWTQPERASVDLRHDRIGLIIFGTIGAIASVVTLGLGWWMLGRKLSIIRALRHGEIREARVTALERTNTEINKQQQYRLEWRDATGAEGRSMMASHNKLAAYPVGDVIIVYIDPKTGTGWWDVQVC
ncbi:DUF3592 domain-containing protein [Roseinatronobacter alkalisoli]|uniref:DUF3592 domain-containing protein n=1 Tax=Roseinatronobacter alkalisoli TaxID=3028235 RepID=A0ABT5T9B4_9RHOB|nr:DUF3592 domain-containing protein [Roseinatronobacter sp. HJB301]MDD7971713.1 DUF3592 domain-containing protein [Roseinatronobacter sp. HJB301]